MWFSKVFLCMTGLALAGCSREADAPLDGSGEPAGLATPYIDFGPIAAPASETGAPVSAGRIPEKLRGRWGLVPADCTSTHGDAKGLLEVGADTLTFYESRATLTELRESGADRIRADFAFSGEGQEWTQDVELRIWGGAKLIRQDRGPDAMPGPLAYARCTS